MMSRFVVPTPPFVEHFSESGGNRTLSVKEIGTSSGSTLCNLALPDLWICSRLQHMALSYHNYPLEILKQVR